MRGLALATLALLVAAACGPAAPSGGPAPTVSSAASAAGTPVRGGTMTFALENDVINFDPLLSRAFVDRNVLYLIYDSLVRIDAKGTIIPWLAERWTVAEDGKTVTFELRQDVRFHDGTPFDAAAVKWNIERYKDTKGSQRSGELASVDHVEVVGTSVAKFVMKAPFAALLAALVDRAGMMVSRKQVEALGDDFTRKAFRAGTGPFILTEAVKDDHITLERNAEWWGRDAGGGKLPYIDKVIVKPITDADVRLTNVRTGSVQIMNAVGGKDVAGVKSDPDLTYIEKPSVDWLRSLIPNRAPGFLFSEGRYVKAVAMVLDRKQILDSAYFGLGSVGYGPIAPSHFAFDPDFKPFEKPDIEGAKKIIQEVGKGPLSFELLVRAGDPQEQQIAQLIQSQLKKADITVTLKQLQFAEILDLQTKHSFLGMTLVGWSGRIDPDGNVYDHVYTGRPNNDSSYSNKEVDRLLDEQRQTFDQAKRRSALRAAEKIFVVDDPARVWFRFGVSHLLMARKVKGLEPYPDQIIRFQLAWLGS